MQFVNYDTLNTCLNKFSESFKNTSNLFEKLSRYACTATNELEGVFDLKDSYVGLVKEGFHQDLIGEISESSKEKNKDTIIKILKNTLTCLDLIGEILKDTNNFNENYLNKLHKILMEDCNIDEIQFDEYKSYRLIKTDIFRKVACRTTYDDMIVQFCHPTQIDSEMSVFCDTVRYLLDRKDIDPFEKAAWIQYNYLTIHPYEDGNGRISRIISSIPLYQFNLSPIVITNEYKDEYFKSLRNCQIDVSSLKDFIIKSFFTSLNDIENM